VRLPTNREGKPGGGNCGLSARTEWLSLHPATSQSTDLTLRRGYHARPVSHDTENIGGCEGTTTGSFLCASTFGSKNPSIACALSKSAAF